MKTLFLTLSVFFGFTSISWAVPVTFIYDSTTDASAVGGSSNESVNIEFTFDSNLLNGTGFFSIGPNVGSYGPWDGTLRIGTDTVSLTGGIITIFNDVGATFKSDQYDLRWDGQLSGTSTGSLFGETLAFFRVLILDDDLDMLSSTSLPTDPSFALKGDRIQDSFAFSGVQSFGLSEFSGPGRSFTLSTPTPVPEPSTYLLLGFGLIGLLIGCNCRHRKQSI